MQITSKGTMKTSVLPSRWKGFIVVIFQEGAQLLVIQHADEPNDWQVSPAKVAIRAEHVVHEPWSSHCLGRKFSKLFQTSNSDFAPKVRRTNARITGVM